MLADMSKNLPLAFVALAGAIVVAGWSVSARWRSFQAPPAPPDATDERFATRLVSSACRIGDGLYLFGHLAPAAAYVIETDDGLVMVDTGLEAEYDKITQAMKLLGLDLTRLKIILLTHAHGDHTMGAERLRRETGARVYIGREDAAPLREGGPWDAIFSEFDMPGVTTHPTEVDGELVDGQVLTLGQTRITTIATPGHTLGSVCYLVEHRGMRILYAGDTIMSLANGLGTYSASLAPRFRGDAGAYLSSLRKLRAMPRPDLVLPGHPNSDPVAQDPRLTERKWIALLDRGISELEQLAERFTQDGADFLDGAPKQLATGLYYLGDLDGHAAYAFLGEQGTMLFDVAGRDAVTFLASAWRSLKVEAPPVAALLLTSCRADNIAGLQALLDATGCRVVTSPAGAKAIRRDCPGARIVTIADLEPLEQPGLKALATPGRDMTSVAYSFQAADDQVLVTGEIPLEISDSELQQLLVDGEPRGWNLAELQDSLLALERLRPKLWLSAHPFYGRNANLYDEEWGSVLSRSRRRIRQVRRVFPDNRH